MISHYWPSINANTVWDLTYGDWRLYAYAADEIIRKGGSS